MKIAIVILNYNGRAWLEQFLPSVMSHSTEHLIYVADNASTDDSVAWLTTNYPVITCIPMAHNNGYAGGYNEALQHITEPVACLLNNDVQVTKGWLEPIAQRFQQDPMLGALQPKIRDYNRRDYFEYAGAAGGFIDRFAYPYCRGRIFNTLEKDFGQYDNRPQLDWASGAALFINIHAYRVVGGMDSDYFAHQEEVDLCWRLRLQGYTIGFEPLAVVYHVGGGTLKAHSPKKTFYNFRNSLFNIVKNEQSRAWWGILLLRMLLDGIAAIRFLLVLQADHCMAILQAHFSFYKYLPTMLKKRKVLTDEKNRVKPKITSIVIQYFIHKRKNFSDF